MLCFRERCGLRRRAMLVLYVCSSENGNTRGVAGSEEDRHLVLFRSRYSAEVAATILRLRFLVRVPGAESNHRTDRTYPDAYTSLGSDTFILFASSGAGGNLFPFIYLCIYAVAKGFNCTLFLLESNAQ